MSKSFRLSRTPAHCRRHLAAAILCLLGIALTLTTVSCNDQSTGEVLVVVDGKSITRGDLLDELRRTRGPATLLQMIDEQIIMQEAEREKLAITAEQIKTRLEQAEANAGSQADLAAKLKKRGITQEQFQQELTYDLYLGQIVRKQAVATDAEVEAYYKQHAKDFRRGERIHARMILVESKENAQAVETALGAGGDFTELAKNLSTDPATKDKGGEMGIIERKDYAKEITDVAFGQKSGSVSAPFKSPDGWCIVQALERVAAGVLPLAQVKEEIRSRILRDKEMAVRDEWLNQQRTTAKLNIPDAYLRSEVQKLIAAKAPCTIGQP